MRNNAEWDKGLDVVRCTGEREDRWVHRSERVGKGEGGPEEGKRGSGQGMRGWW